MTKNYTAEQRDSFGGCMDVRHELKAKVKLVYCAEANIALGGDFLALHYALNDSEMALERLLCYKGYTYSGNRQRAVSDAGN